jgi:hypothetical protein
MTLLAVGLSGAPAYAATDLLVGRWSITDANGGTSIVDIERHGGSYIGTVVAKSSDSVFCFNVEDQILQVTGRGQHFEGSIIMWDVYSDCGTRVPDGNIVMDLNSDGTIANVLITQAGGDPCAGVCPDVVWKRDGPAPAPDRTPLWVGLGVGSVIVVGAAATVGVRMNRSKARTGAGGPDVSFQVRLDGVPRVRVKTSLGAPAVTVRLAPRVSGGPVTIKEVPR